MDTRYPRTVAASRTVSRSLWELADALAAEVPPGSPLSTFDDVAAELVKHNGDTYSPGTLQNYRDTAVAWPPSTRVRRVSFLAHRTLNTDPDRFAKITTVRTAREAAAAAGHRPWDRPARHTPDPREVADAIEADPDVAAAAERALADRLTARQDANRRATNETRREQGVPPLGETDRSDVTAGMTTLQIVLLIRAAEAQLRRAIDLADTVPDHAADDVAAARDALLDAVSDLVTALGWTMPADLTAEGGR